MRDTKSDKQRTLPKFLKRKKCLVHRKTLPLEAGCELLDEIMRLMLLEIRSMHFTVCVLLCEGLPIDFVL